jgi:TonB family protein
MHESGREGPQYDPLPEQDDLALRPQEDEADPEPESELLGPARRSDGSWGTLSAAAVLTVALLGAFLWFHRSDAPNIDPPPYAPPPVAEKPAEPPPVVVEPDPPAPVEPEIVEEPAEEMPAEPSIEPEVPTIEMAPGPARTPPPVQTVEVTPEPAPRPKRSVKPERPRSQEPARVAAVKPEIPVAPPIPKRAYGPPPEKMAGVLRPGPGVEMPVPLDIPSVRYPKAARGSGMRVDVHLDLLVDEQGKVVEAVVRDGDPDNLGFNEAAVQAALGTRFQPATRWDLPGKAWTELILEFEEPPA